VPARNRFGEGKGEGKRTGSMEKETTKNRNRDLLEMVRKLLLAEAAFQEIFRKYKERKLRFSDIENWVDERGQSLLYNLKEQSHSLFRIGAKGSVQRDEWLLDLAIGSIFHEAMKLRENIYQMDVYGPRYLQFKSKMGKTAYEYERNYLQQFERIISRAEQGIGEGMEETRSLFKDAVEQLIDFFRRNSANPYLVRSLLEHRPLLQRVYGNRMAKEIFYLMFKKGLLDAYALAGQSYLQSGHYDLASLYFSKALKMDPSDPELQFFMNFSLGMKAYYKNAYPKTMSFFEKLISLKINKKLKKDYLRKAEEVCHRVSLELKEEGKVRTTTRCRFLADEIRKML
jgi:tetratricopeptide (TPR) repeat protein